LFGQQEGHPACKETDWCVAGMVMCLVQSADLHMVQLMPLLLTISFFSKSGLVLPLLCYLLMPADPSGPRQNPRGL